MKKKAFIAGVLMAAMVLGGVLVMSYRAAATDSPHNLENTLAPSPKGCTQTCHVLHSASGGSLNSQLGNVNLCVYCHKSSAPANTFALPANNPTVPDTIGIHHQYNVPYTNMGGSDPSTLFPGKNVLEGSNIICSSCHDVHVVGANYGPQKISKPPGGGASSKLAKVVGNANQELYVNTVTANAAAKSYKIKILAGGALGVATFIVSNDGGLTWWYWNGTSWTTTVSGGRPTAADVALNDGANVTVKFNIVSGTYAANDEWEVFYVSYPFLRGALDTGDYATGTKFCRGCHANRVNTYTEVRGPGNGTTKFNHPTGAALNANGRGYDNAAPRDANGNPSQSPGDGNPANNLRLAADNTIQCYTCHNVHYGYSNSLVTSPDIPYNW